MENAGTALGNKYIKNHKGLWKGSDHSPTSEQNFDEQQQQQHKLSTHHLYSSVLRLTSRTKIIFEFNMQFNMPLLWFHFLIVKKLDNTVFAKSMFGHLWPLSHPMHHLAPESKSQGEGKK